MKSHKEYKNEYQRWTEEIQALNEAVQCDTKKWKIIGCFFALFASLSFCGSFFAACFICEIATITNLTLSVCITILGFCFWLVLIFYKFLKFPSQTMINFGGIVILISETNGCINTLMNLNSSMKRES